MRSVHSQAVRLQKHLHFQIAWNTVMESKHNLEQRSARCLIKIYAVDHRL